MKYSPEIVKQICELVATGDHIIKDICKQVGISEAIYYVWKEEKLEFLELLKKAEAERLQAFKNMARSGLAKLLDVYEFEEVTTEFIDQKGKPKVKSRKVTKKVIMPNATAVIFALTNQDSENFKHKAEQTIKVQQFEVDFGTDSESKG